MGRGCFGKRRSGNGGLEFHNLGELGGKDGACYESVRTWGDRRDDRRDCGCDDRIRYRVQETGSNRNYRYFQGKSHIVTVQSASFVKPHCMLMAADATVLLINGRPSVWLNLLPYITRS